MPTATGEDIVVSDSLPDTVLTIRTSKLALHMIAFFYARNFVPGNEERFLRRLSGSNTLTVSHSSVNRGRGIQFMVRKTDPNTRCQYLFHTDYTPEEIVIQLTGQSRPIRLIDGTTLEIGVEYRLSELLATILNTQPTWRTDRPLGVILSKSFAAPTKEFLEQLVRAQQALIAALKGGNCDQIFAARAGITYLLEKISPDDRVSLGFLPTSPSTTTAPP